MTEGVVVGGWGFVWGAYALTFTAFIAYGIMLVLRVRSEGANQGDLK